MGRRPSRWSPAVNLGQAQVAVVVQQTAATQRQIDSHNHTSNPAPPTTKSGLAAAAAEAATAVTKRKRAAKAERRKRYCTKRRRLGKSLPHSTSQLLKPSCTYLEAKSNYFTGYTDQERKDLFESLLVSTSTYLSTWPNCLG